LTDYLAREYYSLCSNFRSSHYGRSDSKWVLDVADRTDSDELNLCIRSTMGGQLSTLLEIQQYHGSLDVAINIHLMPRYDKTHGKEM